MTFDQGSTLYALPTATKSHFRSPAPPIHLPTGAVVAQRTKVTPRQNATGLKLAVKRFCSGAIAAALGCHPCLLVCCQGAQRRYGQAARDARAPGSSGPPWRARSRAAGEHQPLLVGRRADPRFQLWAPCARLPMDCATRSARGRLQVRHPSAQALCFKQEPSQASGVGPYCHTKAASERRFSTAKRAAVKCARSASALVSGGAPGSCLPPVWRHPFLAPVKFSPRVCARPLNAAL